jgi:hypothetical protein
MKKLRKKIAFGKQAIENRITPRAPMELLPW